METENQIDTPIRTRITCNVVVPASGEGRRYKEQGFTIAKPLIDIFGPPMIYYAITSVNVQTDQNIFIFQPEHLKKRDICGYLNGCIYNTKYVWENPPLYGPAHSVSLAKELIDNDTPLIICNSDHKIEWESDAFLRRIKESGASGGVVSFYCKDEVAPIYSYVGLDENGRATGLSEKIKISNYCCAGIYIFASGREYLHYYNKVVEKGRKINGEYYVSTVMDEMIKDNKLIINNLCVKYQSFGTPEDLKKYMENLPR